VSVLGESYLCNLICCYNSLDNFDEGDSDADKRFLFLKEIHITKFGLTFEESIFSDYLISGLKLEAMCKSVNVLKVML